MRSGAHFPDDQAEIVFNDVFVEYLDQLTPGERESVQADVVALCTNPVGTHPLSNRGGPDRLAGWNTLDVLAKEHRVVFASRTQDGVGVVEVLCAGPRRADAAYDLANALLATGRLSAQEVTEIWQALTLLDVITEQVGLDGWDYRPRRRRRAWSRRLWRPACWTRTPPSCSPRTNWKQPLKAGGLRTAQTQSPPCALPCNAPARGWSRPTSPASSVAGQTTAAVRCSPGRAPRASPVRSSWAAPVHPLTTARTTAHVTLSRRSSNRSPTRVAVPGRWGRAARIPALGYASAQQSLLAHFK